jgi:predicted AlkP superfamily pyrophosphatase or phosphodiesterase
VQLAHDFAGNSSGLYVTFIGPEAHFAHLIDDSSLHRLESIACVWQGAGVDDRVRVLQKRLLHFVLEVDILNSLLSDVFLGHNSFTCACAKLMGMSTMLPALPNTFGRLTDVYASCLGAITKSDNRLGFRPAKRVIAVLVDGLGAQNLKGAAGHAPFLNQTLSVTKPVSCGFPSTTATSITSFGTGLSAGEHGLVGYKVFDRQAKRSANLLTGWGEEQNADTWQPQQTISQRALGMGIGAFVIGPKAYATTGFTSASMRDAEYLPGRSISDRIDVALELLRRKSDDFLVYLYIPELDQAAHTFGSESRQWLEGLEEVDYQLRRLANGLGKSDALLVTADHGIVDVHSNGHVYIDELAVDWDRVIDVSGDPRVNFIYLEDSSQSQRFASELQAKMPDGILVLTRDSVLEENWYRDATQGAVDRMPDVFALATKQLAMYHRGFAPAKSLEMIGQHGALSAKELSIPLLGFGAFATKN